VSARARAKKPAGPLSEAALTVLLKERFAAPEYAFIPQVRNGTGYTRSRTRTADALAMSLWPSRGLELIGFELKSDRADWLREKGDPEKAEEIGKFCDRWWVVTGAEDVVHQDDLFPPTWGLMVAAGGKLRVVREAPKLDAKPLDRAQLAAILRRAAECVVPKAEVDAATEKRIEEVERQAEERVDLLVKSRNIHLQHEVKTLTERVETFEKASGVSLARRWDLDDIGAAVKFIVDGGMEKVRADLEQWRERAREVATAIDHALAVAPKAKTGTGG
jgi:hypothetical protein